ncbi:MAG TPA: hydroxymethylbilane synthase [Alphaproteobacteria bacterium]|nr:hydroxymethylbilane synthase [Alphaproteobacteria bacterium]
MKTSRLVIGTRGSPLALAQAREVETRLKRAHPELAQEGAIEFLIIRTSGDNAFDRPLYEMGGKGLFTKEIEEALLDKRIDIAVHSVKDLPAFLPGGLGVVCVLPREDPRDVLFSPRAASLAGLPQGAALGTSSPRRQAQVLALRPDLEVRPLRGNVGTRLRKVREGEVDATLLALAGLKRLGLESQATAVLSSAEILPAIGQGALGIECREDDARARELLAPLNDASAALCIAAERALLATLEGSCRTPIAGLAEIAGDGTLDLRGLVASLDGKHVIRAERRGSPADAARMGTDAGVELRARAGRDFFNAPA